MIASWRRYFHTVRYLRPVQIYGRIFFKLCVPRVDNRPPPPLHAVLGDWEPPAQRQPGLLDVQRFRLLNAERNLKSASDWNNPEWPKLWLYQLHYFHDLTAKGAEERCHELKALILRWIRENPPTTGIGWEPYPLSQRIVNWIKWSLGGDPLPKEAIQSLALQSRYLFRRCEYHLLGNHLLANAKALVFAGLFFDGDDSCQWLRKGIQLLVHEIPEQVLPDGGHFERSATYHSIIFEDLLDIINITRTYQQEVAGTVLAAAERMRRWMETMCHPDGQIVLFNDAAFNGAPTPWELIDYAARLGISQSPKLNNPLSYLADSGYVRVENGPVVAFLDVASLGPDYLPAHGHADNLTFELSLHGQRLIVDSGTSTYEPGAERLRQRGTSAHNTVVLDDQNSSEVWGSFRVARRAKVINVITKEEREGFTVCAAHDGYRRLGISGLHTRTWRLQAQSMDVLDEIDGDGRHVVKIFFHIHPDVEVLHRENDHYRLILPSSGIEVTLSLDEQFSTGVVDSTYHPEFGMSVKNNAIVGQYNGPLPARFVSRIGWK